MSRGRWRRSGRQPSRPRPPLKAVSVALAALLTLCCWSAGATEADTTASSAVADVPAQAHGGAVAAPHAVAADVGQSILSAGGSAMDAAIAVALAIGVVRPQSSGLGGGGFAVYRLPDGTIDALDFREVGPSFFTADVYSTEGRDSRRGPWSTGVPGEAAGLASLHRLGGSLPWSTLVEPARRLATDGFVVDRDLASALVRDRAGILADPGLSAVFAPQGELLQEGQLCTRPALGRTLEYLSAHGGDALYEGPLAVALSGFLAQQGLPWTPDELAAYEVRRRPPLVGSYRGHRVYVMGPPSSGGIAMLETLGILEHRSHHRAQFGSVAWTRTLVGALSHAFADRAAYGGDPDHGEIPVEALLDSALHGRLAGSLPARGPVALHRAGLAGERGDTGALLVDDSGTTHISVLDDRGGAVALTTTINLSFGSLQADPQTGIILNDEMDDFSARPGVANAFGLVQGDNNLPGPGRRPLSSMSPTLVADKEGRVILAVGGAGGPRIISGTLQTLLAVMDRGLSAEAAVGTPRLHHQWLPRTVFVESSFSEKGRRGLGAEGFMVDDLGYAGVVQAVTFDPASGLWGAGADPRASGGARTLNP